MQRAWVSELGAVCRECSVGHTFTDREAQVECRGESVSRIWVVAVHFPCSPFSQQPIFPAVHFPCSPFALRFLSCNTGCPQAGFVAWLWGRACTKGSAVSLTGSSLCLSTPWFSPHHHAEVHVRYSYHIHKN